MYNDQQTLIGGLTIREWNKSWRRVPSGLKYHQPDLTDVFGLYHYTQNGQSMALGQGTDRKGGLAKRPSDFIRPSSSGRRHHAGRLIFEHREKLELWVLITGSDEDARALARHLKDAMLAFHKPAWNAPNRRAVNNRKLKPRRQSPPKAAVALPTGFTLRGIIKTGPSSEIRA